MQRVARYPLLFSAPEKHSTLMDMFHHLVTKNLAENCNTNVGNNLHSPLELKYMDEDGTERNLIGDVIYEFPVEVESYTGVDKAGETFKDRYLAFSLFTLSFTSSSNGKYSSSTDIWPLNLHLYSFISKSTPGGFKTRFTLLPSEERKYVLPTYSFLVPSKYCKLVSDKIARHAAVAIPGDYLSL